MHKPSRNSAAPVGLEYEGSEALLGCQVAGQHLALRTQYESRSSLPFQELRRRNQGADHAREVVPAEQVGGAFGYRISAVPAPRLASALAKALRMHSPARGRSP